MTIERRMDSDLPRILGDIAAGPYPDYIDDVLSTTAQRRQRPAWTFPERWLPMETVAAQVTTTRFPMRSVGVLALVAMLIVTALAVYVGTQQPPLPAPPYGLADNGRVAFMAEGDILVADGPTADASVLIGGQEVDDDPVVSLDGQRIAFSRRVDGTLEHLMLAGVDGSAPIAVTPEPIDDIAEIAFAPDGGSLAIVGHLDGARSLAIVNADGSDFRWLVTGDHVRGVSFLPPAGAALMFILGTPDARGEAIVRLDLATDALGSIVPALEAAEFHGRPNANPDGSLIVYARGVIRPESWPFISTVPPVTGATPVALTQPDEVCCELAPVFSNDGRRIALIRIHVDGLRRVAIVDADTGGPGLEVSVGLHEAGELIWSPDDRYLFGSGPLSLAEPGYEHVFIDVEAGEPTLADWASTSYPTWQRIGTGN